MTWYYNERRRWWLRTAMKFLHASLVFFLLTSCGPSNSEPVVDQATVVAKNASLRLKNSPHRELLFC